MKTATSTELIPQSSREMLDTNLNFWNSIQEITITNDQEYEQADENINKLKTGKKDLESNKLELTKSWREKTNFINAEYKTVVEQLENGIKKLDGAMGFYHGEQVRKAAEEQKRLQAEADEKIRKEQERAEKDLQKANEYREQGREEMADKREAAAESHIESATTIVARTVITSKPKGSGFQEYYEASVINKGQAVQFCMSLPDLEKYISIDMSGIETVQKNAEGKRAIPGMLFVKKFRTRKKGRS